MRQIKNIVLLFSLLLAGCVKPFNPDISTSVTQKYVVSGRVTSTEGWQDVEVSRSSPVQSSVFLPTTGCKVTILDDQGNVFPAVEYKPGTYHVWIGQSFLAAGTSFRVRLLVPGGDQLESAFDRMPSGPVLDSVYYAMKDIPTSDPSVSLRIMQFYVDIYAKGDFSQYYKWDVTETWEYHAAHNLEYYYDGTHHRVNPPDSSKKVCYYTGLVKNIFTVSTKSLFQNTYKQFPLHAIDGTTSRLAILYSILVRQLALSEKAYNYWEQMRINSNEQGGLYEKQPLAIKGNVVNLTHPEQDVLGFFYASSESTRRYFYKNVPGIALDFNNGCTESGLGRFGWREFTRDEYPVYYYYPTAIVKVLDHECVDCRLGGGVLEKPDFWPN